MCVFVCECLSCHFQHTVALPHRNATLCARDTSHVSVISTDTGPTLVNTDRQTKSYSNLFLIPAEE